MEEEGGQLASYSLEWFMIKGGSMVVEVGNIGNWNGKRHGRDFR